MYSLAVMLIGDWPLDFGAFAWVITGVELRSTNDPAVSPQVWVAGAFNVAGMDVGVSAELPAPDGGWIFAGKTRPGQQIALGDLLEAVTGNFGVTVPEPVRSLYVSDLDVRVDTGTRAVRFGCRGGFTFAEHEIALAFSFDVHPAATDAKLASAGPQAATDGTHPPAASEKAAKASPRFELTVSGSLAVAGQSFTLTFDETPGSTSFRAEWAALADATGKKSTLDYGDLAGLFGFDPPEIPEGLDLALDAASFTYDFATRRLALTAHSLHYGGAVFVADASGDRTRFLFGLALDRRIELTDLPVVGQAIPREMAFFIADVHLWLSSGPVDVEYAAIVGRLLPAGAPALPAAGLDAGAMLSVDLRLGPSAHTLTLGTAAPGPASLQVGAGTAGTAAPQPPAATGTSAPTPASPAPASSPSAPVAGVPAPGRADDGAKWIDVQKTLGPVSLQRVGFRYGGGRITVLFDGGISIAGFTFSLQGLQASAAFRPPMEVSLGLDGLGLAVDRDPLLISGAFLRAHDPAADWKYAGEVNVRFRDFGLAAVGAYASRGGQSSLFVFGSIDTPLGGPPAFFVTGLSAGVGFNSRVRLPGQDEVQDFPLVAGVPSAPRAPGEPLDPLAVLDALQGTGPAPWITPEPGQVWIAAGVQFTSFRMVSTRALLLANLGERDLSFALLGLSEAQLPPSGGKLFARVGLQLAAVVKPLEGFLGVTAVLTRDSWVLDPACRLTGGFAFFLWFDGPHQGDFVLTVGGYHPSFAVPAHYPRVERLGFNWPVSDSITLKGGTYFALTPSCIMAGVALEATFSSGDLKAWFRASADFIAQWHPFHFDARVAVTVGASYRLNLLFTTTTPTVEIGAELHLWGPPMGGTVHVDWTVISFTVAFGDQPRQQPPTLTWAQFEELLPPPDARLTLNLEGVQAGAGGERLARPDGLSFSARAAIPATHVGAGSAGHGMDALSIRPMGIRGVSTPLTVTVRRDEVVVDVHAEGWTVEPLTQNQPEALWGAPLDGAPAPAPAAALLPDRLAGVRVRAPRAAAGATPGPIDVERNLGYEAVASRAPLPLDPQRQQGAPAPAAGPDVVAAMAAQADSDAARAARAAAFAALAALGAAPAAAGGLAGVARDAALLFADAPMRAA